MLNDEIVLMLNGTSQSLLLGIVLPTLKELYIQRVTAPLMTSVQRMLYLGSHQFNCKLTTCDCDDFQVFFF